MAMVLIDRKGERTRKVCEQHRIAYEGRTCPKCKAAANAKARWKNRAKEQLEWIREYREAQRRQSI